MAPTKNPQKAQLKYYKTIEQFLRKPPVTERSRKRKQEKREERFKKFEDDHILVHKVEKVNGDKAFSTIYLHLNTKPAFPGMPDLENMEKQLLEKSFEEGEPNGDIEFANLKERLLAKVVKQVSTI